MTYFVLATECLNCGCRLWSSTGMVISCIMLMRPKRKPGAINTGRNLVYYLDSVTKRKHIIDEFTVPILSTMCVKSFDFKLQFELNVYCIPQIFITNLQHRIVDSEVKSYFSILWSYYLTEDHIEVLNLLTSSPECYWSMNMNHWVWLYDYEHWT